MRAVRRPTASDPYTIERHQHLFAAWAASRAASVKGCRFTVRQGRSMLEAAGLDAEFSSPELLPEPAAMDSWHKTKRQALQRAATTIDPPVRQCVSDGVAAKLLNVYFKSRFVCGGHHGHIRVQHLHPPIDDVLLKTLADADVGGFAKEWRRIRWSRFDSEQYERRIGLIRQCLCGKPLWMIEEYWRGNQ